MNNKKTVVGKPFLRKEAVTKVTGEIKYTADYQGNFYYAYIIPSQYAHANILDINYKQALEQKGVKAILTGKEYPILTGPIMADRPVLAINKVRYYGEPVVLIVADTEQHAKGAVEYVQIHYDPLPVLNNVESALNTKNILLHPDLEKYEEGAEEKDVFPVPQTNIANLQRIRKGNVSKAFRNCDYIVENTISFSQSDHAAMETHCCFCNIESDGKVNIYTTSQGPFIVKEYISQFFNVSMEKINVTAPPVGGAYGGKTPVVIECLAYLGSEAVGGHPVKLLMPRHEDMITCPVHIGLTATIKLGATKEGYLQAYHGVLYFDGGAYSDKAVVIARAGAQNCTGPYKIDNVYCDSYCVYTNHTFATAFRGFGHTEMIFAVERAMDILAKKLNMDPLHLRYLNAIQQQDTTPTSEILIGKLGDLKKCIDKLKVILDWDGISVRRIDKNTVLAKGIGCFWKSFSLPSFAKSGTVLTFDKAGSVNLISGIVEIGQGTKSGLVQIVSEVLTIPYHKINVIIESNTSVAPHDWKTAASRGMFIGGRATLRAARDAKEKILERSSFILRTNKDDLELKDEKVIVKTNPDRSLDLKDIVLGYTYPNGNSIFGEIIGVGTDIVNNISHLKKETGQGNPSSDWTVAAQAVEIVVHLDSYTYDIKRAYTVIDAGTIINPTLAKGQVIGGMNMGLSFASREAFYRNSEGITLNANLRTYLINRYGEVGEYIVDFVETPQLDGPFGARGIGEHGIIGMPAALCNALSMAFDAEINQLPLIPEMLWRYKEGMY